MLIYKHGTKSSHTLKIFNFRTHAMVRLQCTRHISAHENGIVLKLWLSHRALLFVRQKMLQARFVCTARKVLGLQRRAVDK
jgi:hypothetical protein